MNRKLQKNECFDAEAVRIMPGGFNQAGQVAITYPENISGTFVYISPRHLYQKVRGIDVYPTPEQVEQMLNGEQVTFNMTQWA